MSTILGWFFLVLVCLGILWLFGAAFWISELLYHARRVSIARTPQAVGLNYEAVSLSTRDHLTLQGWWIPTQGVEVSRRAVILLHPMFGNRLGLESSSLPLPDRMRANLDLLPLARSFHQAGYHMLLLDFRNHGESQAGMSAGGLTEDQDVLAAVDFTVRRLAPGKEDPFPEIGLVGFGLGAAAAIAAVGRQKGGYKPMRVFSGDNEGAMGYTEFLPANIKRVSFLVLIQPARLGRLVRGGLRQVSPILGAIFYPLVDRFGQLRGAYPLADTSLRKFAGEVCIPTLWIQSCGDPWLDQAEASDLYDALAGPKMPWWLDPWPEHMAGFQTICDQAQKILAFAENCIEGKWIGPS